MARSPAGAAPSEHVPAIAARAVSVRYFGERGSVTALDGVDLVVAEGEFLTVIGPSGCGKSTLLRVIADLVPPTSGVMAVRGGTPALARSRRDIGFVFQDAALLPWRTALQNVALPLQVGGGAGRQDGRTPLDLLALVGLAERADAYPHELSGGQRQRVAIARALASHPRILLLDEPFGALDEITRDRLNEELLRLWRQTGLTVVFVTHGLQEAAFLGQRVLVMGAPGLVRAVVPVDLPADRTLAVRESPAFLALAARLRAALFAVGDAQQ